MSTEEPTALPPVSLPASIPEDAHAELSRLRSEVKHLKERERDIIEACERVADGGQYRNDIVSAIQRIRRERDDLRKQLAGTASPESPATPPVQTSVNPKLGDPIWIFDQSHRVYRTDPVTKRQTGSPIWREHWVKRYIVGENRRSWYIGSEYMFEELQKKGQLERAYLERSAVKIAKADLPTHLAQLRYLRTLEEIEKAAWLEAHTTRIVDAIRYSKPTYDQVRAIAKILQYEDTKLDTRRG